MHAYVHINGELHGFQSRCFATCTLVCQPAFALVQRAQQALHQWWELSTTLAVYVATRFHVNGCTVFARQLTRDLTGKASVSCQTCYHMHATSRSKQCWL